MKTIQELKTINDEIQSIISQPDKTPHVLHALSRLMFGFYYMLDNIHVLVNIKYLLFDKKPYYETGNMFWLIGLILGVLKDLYDLKIAMAKKVTNEDEKLARQKNILKAILGISAKFGDMVSAANGARVSHKIFGESLSELTMSIGGLISGICGCIQLWRK